MRLLVLSLFLSSIFGVLSAAEFSPDEVIHPEVAKLGTPTSYEGFGRNRMMISSDSAEAVQHVFQGFSHLNTSWDFEAYRHFCEAVKHDPDCIMAYSGLVLSLARGAHEFFDQRQRALERLLDLLEWEAENESDQWSRLEKGYAQAVGTLVTEGSTGASRFFANISKEFPNDLQAKLFAQLLSRDGFDSLGKPRLGQRKTNEAFDAILDEYPYNLAALSYWITTQTEAPLNAKLVQKEILPVARELAEAHSKYPPFQLMLAHTASRCGEFALALEAAKQAISGFESYMKEEKVRYYDCSSWVRAKIYECYLEQMLGRHDVAVKLSKKLAALKVEKKRVFSSGAAMVMWEARTIGARLMMSQSGRKDFFLGQKILDTLPAEQWHQEQSFALLYRDCIAFYLGARIAIQDNEPVAAAKLYESFIYRAQIFEKQRELAIRTSSYANWLRANHFNVTATVELKGLIAELSDGSTRLSAATWYRSAIERQFRSANQLPPVIHYPMELRLADFSFSLKKYDESIEAYQEGLKMQPNHLRLLKGYEIALRGEGRDQDAREVQTQIKALKN